MNIFKKLFSRQFYRSLPFWFLSLLTAYTGFGFLLLPKLISETMSEQIYSHLGWQTTIEQVEVNPFLLTVTINQLSIVEDNHKRLSFSRFHADFELRSLIEAAYTFKNIELIDPNFNLTINKDGSTNIQQALTAHQQPIKKEQKDNESGAVMPNLLFDNISVVNGSLNASDYSQGAVINHRVTPISFKLSSFSTYIKKGGDYQLNLALDNNQSVQWRGNISVAPISSSGSFNVKGIQLQRFWPYIKTYSPYELRHSDVDLAADYALSFIDNQFQLTLNNAQLTLSDLQLADPQKQDHFVEIKQIKVGPTQFNLLEKYVRINNITVDAIALDLMRNKSGELELLQPLHAFNNKQTTTKKSKGTTATTPFSWSIEEINIKNSAILVNDRSLTNEATINIDNINASLFSLNQSLTNKQPYSLSYQVESSQKNTIIGELVVQPFTIDSNLTLSSIPINIIQPYLSEFTNIEVTKGAVSLQGHSKLAIDNSKGLLGSFKGEFDISDFDSRDTLIKRRLLGWEKLSVAPISVNLSPLTIDINKIKFNKPYSRLVITEDRKINFSQLMVEKNQATAPKQQTDSDKQSHTNINIAEITINDGGAYFADLSLRPQFSTSIQSLNGYIKGLSSNNIESADIDITGSVEKYGKVAIEGKINPLSGDLYSDINVNFDKIELTTLTPYSGRYAGYVIDKGKLSLALNYKIAKGILDGKNRLILDQFELGDRVDSEEAIDLPIKLALALFKDSHGVIDISLPTKGDMNSPDFEIGGLVMKALLNLMSKAVSSPFSLLANMAGGDEQSLNSVAFELGKATLSAEQKGNLKTLAELLNARPQLILELRVNVDSEQETQILKQQALTAQLALNDKNTQQQVKAMELLFSKLKGEKALTTFKDQLVTQQEKQQRVDEKQFQQHYQQRLFEQLVLLQPIERLQLSELAQQRISVIKHELITVNKVQNQQVFALQPSLTGSAQDSLINTVFSLNSK